MSTTVKTTSASGELGFFLKFLRTSNFDSTRAEAVNVSWRLSGIEDPEKGQHPHPHSATDKVATVMEASSGPSGRQGTHERDDCDKAQCIDGCMYAAALGLAPDLERLPKK